MIEDEMDDQVESEKSILINTEVIHVEDVLQLSIIRQDQGATQLGSDSIIVPHGLPYLCGCVSHWKCESWN